jgi:hypothetical protein
MLKIAAALVKIAVATSLWLFRISYGKQRLIMTAIISENPIKVALMRIRRSQGDIIKSLAVKGI